MDFWKSLTARNDETDNRRTAPEPSFFAKLTEFAKDEAKDEAIGSVVEYLSDGWITYEGGDDDDDEDERPRRKVEPRSSFEERLQRGLAELAPPETARETDRAPEPTPEPVPELQPEQPIAQRPAEPAMPIRPRPAPSSHAPAARPALRGPQGFGRKGL